MRHQTLHSRLRGPNPVRTILLCAALAATGADARGPREAWRATLEGDSAAVLGAWVENQMHARKLQRTRDALGYQDAAAIARNHRPYGLESGNVVSVPAAIGGVATICSAFNVFTVEESGMRNSFTVGLPLMGIVFVGTTALAIGSNVASVESSGQTSFGDSKDELAYSLHKKRARAEASLQAEIENSTRQAAVVSDLKKTAAAISSRLSEIYGLPQTARLEFERAIEKRILEGFAADKTWTPQTPVKIDVAKILRQVMNDADARIELVDAAVRAGRTAKAPSTKAEARAAYDGMIRETEEIVNGFAAAERAIPATEASSAEMTRALRDFRAFASEQEALLGRLKLHQKLIR